MKAAVCVDAAYTPRTCAPRDFSHRRRPAHPPAEIYGACRLRRRSPSAACCNISHHACCCCLLGRTLLPPSRSTPPKVAGTFSLVCTRGTRRGRKRLVAGATPARSGAARANGDDGLGGQGQRITARRLPPLVREGQTPWAEFRLAGRFLLGSARARDTAWFVTRERVLQHGDRGELPAFFPLSSEPAVAAGVEFFRERSVRPKHALTLSPPFFLLSVASFFPFPRTRTVLPAPRSRRSRFAALCPGGQ